MPATRRQEAPARTGFRRDVLAGLSKRPRTLPCRYLYDERGSRLFERICELDEYYPTRTELDILRTHAGEMAAELGEGVLLIEFGSGNSRKVGYLLDELRSPAGYVPVDIAREHLEEHVARLRRRYPDLTVRGVCGDFTQPLRAPLPRGRRVVFFPGSTIGNFAPREAEKLLASIAELVGPGGGLLIGVDLPKGREVLEAAYDDVEGVTAEFNRNLLVRIVRECDTDLDPESFSHLARYNAAEGRVEMHLVSDVDQTVTIEVREFAFSAGETIHTENSYKYALPRFRGLAENSGWTVTRVWTDPREWFSVQYLRVA